MWRRCDVPETEERLCALARATSSASSSGRARRRDAPAGPDRRAVALDGPLVSWVAQLDAADEAELDLEQILGALVAVAPIVGTLRVVSAGRKIVRAAGLAEPVDDA